MALALRAPAKVNLGLRVLGRRADGYHEIETVMHALELHDDVVVESAPSGISLELVTEGAGVGLPVPVDASNLVWRAAECFLAHSGIRTGVRLHVTKRIPAGGGLGGGSSDAAATLRLCDALFGVGLDDASLQSLAVRLGADVPFFLRGGTQVARGIGERLEPYPPPRRAHFVLIVPPFGTSTARVYKMCAERLTANRARSSIAHTKVLSDKGLEIQSGFGNDLEAAAIELHPAIGDLRRRIAGAGFVDVRLSGSGATLFVAFDSEREATAACGTLAALEDEGVVLVATRSGRAGVPTPIEVLWPGSG